MGLYGYTIHKDALKEKYRGWSVGYKTATNSNTQIVLKAILLNIDSLEIKDYYNLINQP